jgi:hypothetical protein
MESLKIGKKMGAGTNSAGVPCLRGSDSKRFSADNALIGNVVLDGSGAWIGKALTGLKPLVWLPRERGTLAEYRFWKIDLIKYRILNFAILCINQPRRRIT